jgi:hypothetical protein
MNISATRDSIRKSAKTDHVVRGLRKNSKMEAGAIGAKNKVH